jgi:hypothetical protein
MVMCLTMLISVQGFFCCHVTKSPAPKKNIQQSSGGGLVVVVSETSLFMKSQQQRGQHDHRRTFFSQLVATVLVVAAPSSSSSSWAAMAMDRDAPPGAQNVFQPGQKLSIDEAKARFVLARKDAQYLLDHYDEVCQGGGDNVRRYLGTVGVTSGMYGIRKVLKELREQQADVDDDMDIVAYTEAMDDFEVYLNQAEGAAYQSLFIEHSSAKGTPEQFLATAKQDVTQMVKYMDMLAIQLGV